MKLVTLCFAFVVAGVGTVGLVAQNRPDFSGVWMDAATNSLVLTVKHDQTVLTYQAGPFSEVTVNMDGSQAPMPLPDGNLLLVKGVWEGSGLVMTFYLPEVKHDIRRMTWTIADGQLVVVTEFFGPPGGPPVRSTKEIFKRR